MKVWSRAVVAASVVVATHLEAAAQSESEHDSFGARPHTGFLIQGRISQYVGGSSGSGIVVYTPASPGAAFGYRGRSWSLAFSPSYTSSARVPSSSSTGGAEYSAGAFGLSVLFEGVLRRAFDGRGELDVLAGAGATLYTRDGVGPGFGLLLGLTGRYWVAPSLGVGASFGESYSIANWTDPSHVDAFHTFATFGAVDVSVVLGD